MNKPEIFSAIESDSRELPLPDKQIGAAFSPTDMDVSLLRDSLEKTPWERMLANDDALNFAESLRAAMKARQAKQAMNRDHDRITVKHLQEIKKQRSL